GSRSGDIGSPPRLRVPCVIKPLESCVSHFTIDDHLRLTRYLSGSCSAAEAAELERWLAAEPARQAELDALRRCWEASAGLPPTDRVDEMWNEVARQIKGHTAAPEPSRVPRPVLTLHRPTGWRARWPRWGWPLALVASAAALILGVGRWGLHRDTSGG